MSDYGFAFAMLPLAFLAVICTASGLRAAYVCRVPGDASVWFEGTAVLLACDYCSTASICAPLRSISRSGDSIRSCSSRR